MRDEDGRNRLIWIARVRCRACGVTQALLPWFVVPYRWDVVDVIGRALEWAAAGLGVLKIAAELRCSPTTVREWVRRFRKVAAVLATEILAVAASWGWSGWQLPTASPARMVAAVDAAAGEWRRRHGGGRRWRVGNLVCGGRLLARNTTSLLASARRWSWMTGHHNQEVPDGP